ncbi:response regulator transcription factor [Terracidiphilus gabretensis]|uniref:response regulator transcription factor n=1 Tax=Terracidiphilus gabretensis TaxID=1577687 RepID=UPI00071BD241|nr:response regulator transcription factor [Terracidiphilus gabretensis]
MIYNPMRVLCVDDHPLMRDGIAFALQSQKDMELVGEAVDGEGALKQFRELRPDVTLMDLATRIPAARAGFAQGKQEAARVTFF